MSTIPNHTILPLTLSDLPTHAKFLKDSKLPLTINRLLFKDWPNEPAQLANSTRAVEVAFKNPALETFKVVDEKSGDMVAHLVLQRKLIDTKEGSGEHGPAPDCFVPEILAEVGRMVKEVSEGIKDVDHLELTHIYVNPSSRGHGIGSSLVRLALEKAKEAGIPLSVFSEPQSHKFFLRNGLKDTKHAEVDLSIYTAEYCGFGAFRLWGMIANN